VSKVTTKTIDEITQVLIDYRGKTPPKSTSGVRLVTAKVIKGGFVQTDNNEYVTESTYRRWMTRGFPKRWDILITTEAPLGEVAQLRTPERVALAQRVILLRGNPKLIDQQYYFHGLKSPFVQSELASRATGTTVLGIKQSELRQVRIPHWPLRVQRKIGSILSAYDDLIENNERRIRILEELARLLYREWFVHFRFPGHERVKLVESAVGTVPEGWEVKRLGEVCSLVMGQSPRSEFYNTDGRGLPFHQGVTDFGPRFPRERVYCTVTSRLAESGDILFSVRAPVGRINIADKRIVIGRGLSAIRSLNDAQWFLFRQLKDKFREEDTMGGGTIFKAVTKADMERIELLCPPDAAVARFEGLAGPMEHLIGVLTKKNDNLRETRDLLLPKLVSGEIAVHDDLTASPDDQERTNQRGENG
jgi:type I restriction enzyme S subunit